MPSCMAARPFFEKALTANYSWSEILLDRKTEAKAPVPIFLIGLKMEWNSFRMIFVDKFRMNSDFSERGCLKKISNSS